MSNTIILTTDTKDYAPGDWAEISASGVQAGGTLEFQVQHVSGPGDDGVWGTSDDVVLDLGGAGHDAWSVTDGGEGDLDGMVNGAIVTRWYVNPDDSLDQNFLLTARVSGQLIASTGFTDAAGSTNKVYQHWADGDAALASTPEWNNNILNANKSDYFEGEVIPHVFIYKASNATPLVNGQTYSFNVTYNYYQQNTDALGFDYLTTYNASRSPGALGVTSPYIAPSLDSTFTNSGGFKTFGSVSQGFYTVDANITNVSQVTTTGTGTLDHHVTITFVYTGATTTSGVAEVYYGLHLAGPTNTEVGASAWSGGSLQTTVDIGGSGATSIQLAPAAIIAGTISGYKFEDVNGNGSWDSGEQALSGWTIYLDANGNNQFDTGEVSDTTDATGLYSFSVTPDANKATVVNDGYVVREVQQAGWSQMTANPAPIVISSVDPTELNVNFGNQRQVASFKIEKTATLYQSGGIQLDADGKADAAGEVIKYEITMQNTGNTTLTGVTVTDPYADSAPVYASGDANSDGKLDVGETWHYTASHVVTQAELDDNGGGDGKLDNTATGDTTQTDSQQASASVEIFQRPKYDGLIAPTGTTPQQYISGTAQSFEDFYAYQNGEIQYSVKSGKINQTNPGVFYYFTGLSGAIKGADGPDADTKADQMTVLIDQTRTTYDTKMTTPFLTAKSGVVLYKVISSDSVIDASDTLVAVKPTAISAANADGDFSVTFTPDAVGSMYVLAIKYSTVTSFVGGTITNPLLWPIVTYHFDTQIGSAVVESGSGGVDLAPKPASLMLLAGDEGSGEPQIHSAQLHTAFKAALAWWGQQGYDVADLKHQSVQIADLGDSDDGWILGMTSDGQITIDDDAAGHGWSIGIGQVAPNKVDLFSVLVHEIGHELGLSDGQMGDLLEVGARMLPELEGGDSTTLLPLPAALFGLVGTQPAQEPNHFG